jgi:hypothetical protein
MEGNSLNEELLVPVPGGSSATLIWDHFWFARDPGAIRQADPERCPFIHS